MAFQRQIVSDNGFDDAFTQAQIVNETEDLKNIDYIQKGMEELPSWNWAYGQTPEFTYTLNRRFDWGSVTACIRSKHGIINECTFQVTEGRLNDSEIEAISKIGRLLEGQKYGFLEDVGGPETTGHQRDVLTWIEGVVYI
ncbi:hypothetical protein H0H92_005168 [Tricholoma furcatifolium]|nr:hypothetical protein H0H92_005168 [Tricholoma furcatifolium]